MNFNWTINESIANIVTFYKTNITLNKTACRYFNDVNYVLLGIDKDNHSIGIKPIFKDDLDYYPKDNLYKFSLGKSYGRITNKAFIQSLEELIPLSFNDQNCFKFNANFNEKDNILVIDYKGGLI